MQYQILLVDDEPNILAGMRALLQKRCRYSVHIDTAENGEKALEMLGQYSYHLLISDVKMPGIGGIELMKQATARYPELQIILLTGFGDFADIYETTHYRNVKYILKIEDEEDILRIIDTTLEAVKLLPEDKELKSLIAQVEQFVTENIQSSASVNVVAEKFHFSPAHLSRLYKSYAGQNLSNYIKQVQMQEAKRLLAKPGSRIHEISEQLGFSSPSYFILAFKKAEGMTPRQYQQQFNR